MRWCGVDFQGLLLLDECHKARNLRRRASAADLEAGAETRAQDGGRAGTGAKHTVAEQVAALQAALPHAGVVYCRCRRSLCAV